MSLRPPRRLVDVVTAVVLVGLVVVLVPIWAVHRAVSAVRVGRPMGSTRRIRRVNADDTALDDVLSGGEPVIIEGLIERLGLPLVPDLEGLRRLAENDISAFRVRSHELHSPYFLYVGDYGAKLARVDEMTLSEFLDFMFESDDADRDVCTYRLFAVSDLDGAVGEIIDTIADGISELTERHTDRQASGIWIGSKGVVTPLHHDAWTGLLFQFSGSKRVLMFPPTERPNLYFTSPFAATDRWSTLPARSSEADPVEFPRYVRANRFEAQLEAGEVLFIPPFWSHEVEALEPNISIPFRFSARVVDQLNPGFLRPAFEVLHRKYLAPAAVR